MFCECGCGGLTPLARQTHRKLGWVKGQPIRYIYGHRAPKPRPFAERFWEKVDRRGPDECWPWLASCDRKGYGEFHGEAGTLKSHRVAFELTNGPIPPGMNVCHKCDNPPCCNPAHHFLGTLIENNADMRAKGRGSNPPIKRAEESTNARLTAIEVRLIREIFDRGGVSIKALTRLFGASHCCISGVVKRRTWKGPAYEPDGLFADFFGEIINDDQHTKEVGPSISHSYL